MDKKNKELIAIGASITAHCQPCLKYHLEKALELGASMEEINEAISVGRVVEKGALKAMDNFSKEQIEIIEKEPLSFKQGSNCSCSNSDCCL